MQHHFTSKLLLAVLFLTIASQGFSAVLHNCSEMSQMSHDDPHSVELHEHHEQSSHEVSHEHHGMSEKSQSHSDEARLTAGMDCCADCECPMASCSSIAICVNSNRDFAVKRSLSLSFSATQYSDAVLPPLSKPPKT